MGYGMSIIEDNGYFIFDGIKSSDYGVWINGRETFNAPARRYNEYVVPGRNGTLTIDGGSFEDLEVTYPAFIVENFGANIEAFRNQLMTKTGYVRMTDSYHPDEYYLAKYMSGLEANVLPKGVAGSFDLTFKRDPRRFLISGETPVTYPPGITSKNLLPYPYDATSEDIGGIHFEDNGDGSITISGKRTGTASYTFRNLASMPTLTVGERYALNGCPANTGSDNYYLGLKVASSGGATVIQRGLDYQFTYNSGMQIWLFIVVLDSNQHDNLVIKPMIRKASETDPTWKPYISPTEIMNPTVFDSKPIIKVTPYNNYNPSDDNLVSIGDQDITLHNISPYVIINSEIEDCYCGTANLNSQVTFDDGKFPTLKPEKTVIFKSSGIEAVEIIPNWYRL